MNRTNRSSLLVGLFLAAAASLPAQTVFIPSGTSGIGTSSTANVGIGTSSAPAYKLELVDSTAASGIISRFTRNAKSLEFYTGSMVDLQMGTPGNHSLGFYTNNTDPAIVILPTQKVGVGTVTPGAKFEVKGDELRVRSIVAKTDTTLRSLLRLTSDDPVGPTNLEMVFSLQGAAAGGNRYAQIQVGDNGYYWATLALNPYGGKVGVGTATPAAPLHVLGNNAQEIARFQGATDASNYRSFISLYTTNPGFWWELSNQDAAGTGGTNGLAFRERSVSGNSIERVYFAGGGNVGIGTMNTTHKLTVNGQIRAKELIVDTGWSDYVFNEDYRLAPLAEVEAHIKAEKHLPGIPSAGEVAEHGVTVGDMQSKLLAKVEELTLHAIAQEKRLNEQAERLTRLESENARLRSR